MVDDQEAWQPRQTLRIHNNGGATWDFWVSKTLGTGSDDWFTIQPGATEEWRRHVGYRVDIYYRRAGTTQVTGPHHKTINADAGKNRFTIYHTGEFDEDP